MWKPLLQERSNDDLRDLYKRTKDLGIGPWSLYYGQYLKMLDEVRNEINRRGMPR